MKMTGTDNVDVECGENKVEGEDSWRTVECLRGRLFAERMASKNAREEAHQLGIMLVEMEGLLEQEEKWRNKAEKKLKLLMKKLEIVGKSWSVSESDSSFRGSVEEDPYSSSSKTESASGAGAGVGAGVEEGVDNSMAIVRVENERERSVKQVLESLRRAKEQLQSSIERRRMGISMIKVG
ncbi:hypothetical protein SASPL_111638 [Salvia splendens]|uniref:Uncharacterized protein n=2 Tax=Salvia splendens TaxID=180675 RepID=A0A8X9A5C2_SALSN|nr:hypothetical protein SASPL_111638 [Salvia splendens]